MAEKAEADAARCRVVTVAAVKEAEKAVGRVGKAMMAMHRPVVISAEVMEAIVKEEAEKVAMVGKAVKDVTRLSTVPVEAVLSKRAAT